MRGHLSVAILLLSGVLACSSATAQDLSAEAGRTARARELFTEAIGLADTGDWDRAVHRFRTALEYHDAPSIRFNLASSLRHLGRYLEALAELDLVDASADSDPAIQQQAAGLRAQMEPHIGRILVDVRGDANGTYVTVDGRPWDAVGALAPIDPGIRLVRLLRGGAALDSEEADVPDGGEATVTLDAPSVAAAVNESLVANDAGETRENGSGDDGLVWGVVIGSVVVAIGVGVLAGLLVADQSNSASSMGDFTPPVIGVD